MKFTFYTVILLAACTLFGCKKDKRDLASPQPLLLLPMHNNARLSDNDLNGIKLYYIQSPNLKRYVPDFGRASGSNFQDGILSSSDVVALSANTDIKLYFLSFPDGITDTLYVNYETISDEDARNNDCFCNKPLVSFRVNGQSPPVNKISPDGYPVYVIYH
jgi:hypothetical protein